MTKLFNEKTVRQSPIIKTAIFVFAISGNWCPLWWPSRWNFIYYLYSCLTNFILYTHVLSEIINLIVDINTLSEFTNKCISLIPVINACCKGLNIFINRRNIISVLNMLKDDHCRVRNLREIYLQQQYERFVRWINFICLILDLATVISMLVSPFMNQFDTKELPFKAWFPFAVDTEMTFWAVFIYESIASLIATGFFVANDLLVVSMILEICRQLDMLCGTLSDLTSNDFVKNTKQRIHRRDNYDSDQSQEETIKEKLVDCIDHHIFIFELAEATQGCFAMTFAIQMATSLIGTCTNAYHLSRYTVGSPNFNKAGLIFLSLLFEAFLYCWFGNELRLKSLEVGEAAYKMDWFDLKRSLQKDLVNICMRASQPIIFRSMPTLFLSNDAFVTIIQASYTAFTVLKQIGLKSSNAMLSDT